MILSFSRSIINRKIRKGWKIAIMVLLFLLLLLTFFLFYRNTIHSPALPDDPIVEKPLRVEAMFFRNV